MDWPSAHEAVENGKVLIAGCKGVVLHPVDGSNADIEIRAIARMPMPS